MTHPATFTLTFTGTGGVRAAPLFGCQCPACQQAREQESCQRRPTGALIQCENERTLVDAGGDNLSQRYQPGELQRILLTHYHMDHVHGLFPLRWGVGDTLPVFSPPDPAGCDDLYKHPGMLDFRFLEQPFTVYQMGQMKVTPVPLTHSRPTWGYLFEWRGRKVAYLTDTSGLPADTLHFLQQQQAAVIIIDCTYPPGANHNHNDIDEVVRLYDALRPQQMLLTHIDHTLDAWLMMHPLPANITLAQDNQTISLG
ncbi:phosphonate metabolism protein PhnP [Erwinia psidii]|uniref:Phosphonate metabolism protein PhnP n=1 Tax=Erwinia psidii TaxID=69224 RepID=A0A3N6S1T3_9GAMM|nr:phosphonate metabolism protein PhnP [Erwinia psidii]MCX8957669.1 phosphonate metabolism protein PhnP [Erwinia psidii]MCX8960724.1 phosphonate metabolism protein PhnP [Erwinia psidii]MCX8964030.1 phosphonate metabolism protein PhnP [Erwinia psidii]RQM39514.1 phosphonate metabolism protein PhnP [Erwinia psidii]